jgi:hypothetical protein
MAQQHTRAGITHHSTHLLAHIGLVAVYFTQATSTFSIAKRALRQAHMRIVQQRLTRLAQCGIALFISTVESYHQLYNIFFFFDSTHNNRKK